MFAEALTTIIRRLEGAKAQGSLEHYALVGGFAVAAWGVPRATQDLDFALVLGEADPAEVSRQLEAVFHPGGPDDPLRGVFRTQVSVADREVPVQLIILPGAWTSIIVHGIVPLTVFGCNVPVVSWQALILLKLYAGGPQDLFDAQKILSVRHPTPDELEDLARLAARVQLEAAVRSLTAA